MSRKETVVLTAAEGVPPQVGPFAHAVRFGDLVFVTGQMPTDPATGGLVAGGLAEQAEQVRANLAAVLAGCGLTWDDALQVRVYLRRFEEHFEEFNEAYRGWFSGPLPARTTVGVTGLAVGALVEVDLVAGVPSPAEPIKA